MTNRHFIWNEHEPGTVSALREAGSRRLLRPVRRQSRPASVDRAVVPAVRHLGRLAAHAVVHSARGGDQHPDRQRLLRGAGPFRRAGHRPQRRHGAPLRHQHAVAVDLHLFRHAAGLRADQKCRDGLAGRHGRLPGERADRVFRGVRRRNGSPPHAAGRPLVDVGGDRHRFHLDEVCAGDLPAAAGRNASAGDHSHHVFFADRFSAGASGRICGRRAGDAVRVGPARLDARDAGRTGDERGGRQDRVESPRLLCAAVCRRAALAPVARDRPQSAGMGRLSFGHRADGTVQRAGKPAEHRIGRGGRRPLQYAGFAGCQRDRHHRGLAVRQLFSDDDLYRPSRMEGARRGPAIRRSTAWS